MDHSPTDTYMDMDMQLYICGQTALMGLNPRILSPHILVCIAVEVYTCIYSSYMYMYMYLSCACHVLGAKKIGTTHIQKLNIIVTQCARSILLYI